MVRYTFCRKAKLASLFSKWKHITFSAKQALKAKQSVLYVTERAVFELTTEGLELIEVAPGIDMQTQILDLMAFETCSEIPFNYEYQDLYARAYGY